MKNTLIILSLILLATKAWAVPDTGTLLEIEKRIAYEQGRFGALYDLCSLHGEQVMIGGSLAAWRAETFRGYRGSDAERAALLQSFDQAARAVKQNADSCRDWKRQSAEAWDMIGKIAQGG